MLCVIVIIAIASVIAAPRFTNSINLHRIDGASRRMIGDLAMARRRAIGTSVPQTVVFYAGNNAYVFQGMMDPDHPSVEYRVKLDEMPYESDILTADFGGDSEVVFDIFGMPDSGGTVVITVGSQSRTVTLDKDTGKATVQ